MLAAMVSVDEDALYCDFAETYHILEWRRLPARTAAKLAVGLPSDSRIKKKISGVEYDPPQLMINAAQLDALNTLIAMLAGHENPPDRITDSIIGKVEKKIGFETAEEYERKRAEILGGIKNE